LQIISITTVITVTSSALISSGCSIAKLPAAASDPGNIGNGTGNGFIVSAPATWEQGNFAYANALLGNFNNYTESKARNFTNSEIRLWQFYAQDEWRMSRRFTFNYGLRIGTHTPFFQLDGQGSNFDPSRYDPAKAPLLYAGYCNSAASVNGVTPLGTNCPTANQFAIDPRFISSPAGHLLPANLVRSFVPGSGDPLNGIVVPGDPTAFKGFRPTRPVDFEPRVGLVGHQG
jgi:hypothetical protein